LPVGQYEHPEWLFFGGAAPEQSVQALHKFLPSVLGEAEEVAHLDFHTGLGRWGEGELLVRSLENTILHWADYTFWRVVEAGEQIQQADSRPTPASVLGHITSP